MIRTYCIDQRLNQLAGIRQQLGLTQLELAVELGMKSTVCSTYERGVKVPSPYIAKKYIDVAAGRGVRISYDDIYRHIV